MIKIFIAGLEITLVDSVFTNVFRDDGYIQEMDVHCANRSAHMDTFKCTYTSIPIVFGILHGIIWMI